MFSRYLLLALMLAPLLGAGRAAAAPRYSVTALPNGTNPTGINSAGQIAGDVGTDQGRRGFLWSGGALTPIGTLGGADSSATAINDSAHITGHASFSNGDSRAFLYTNGNLRVLPVLGAANSFGIAINNAGHVAGQYIANNSFRAFVHTGGDGTDLGTLGGNFAYASGINGAGHVVGVSALDDASPFLAHAFLYRDGRMTDLGTLGGSYSAATAINDAGQIVGNAWVNGSEHAFLYAGGSMTDLGTLGGRRSFAAAINEAGQVVGSANDVSDFDYFAFLYSDGVMTDLNSLIDPALGWTIHDARGINDSSQIAAYGCRAGECGGLLLQLAVVPEPHTYALLLTGLGLLAWRRAKGFPSATSKK